ncbi:MAG: hypothetical protein ACPL1A_08695 [Candidatus Kapaibacteriota bacterium]
MAEQIKQEEIVLKIEKILPKTKGRFAPEDLAAETGFSLNDINDAVKRLLEIYRAKVVMNPENGKLMFQFNYPLDKIGEKSLKEKLTAVMQWLWRAFQMFYKALTGIILIVYTVIFVLIILFLIFASSSNKDDRRGGGLHLNIFGGIFRAIFEAMYWVSFSNRVVERTDNSGLLYKTYEKPDNKGKGFVQSVFQFVFGPENPPVPENADEKEAIAFIRKVSNGKLTASDIVLLTGITYSQAEERLAEYAAKFGGELEITEEGKVVANFENLLHTKTSNLEGGKIIYYYDEIEPPQELTGNSTGKNVAIIFMNIFNLIMSYIVITGTREPILYKEQYVDVPAIVTYGLGWFPFLFSISFFILPLLRIPFVLAAKKKRNYAIMRKKLFYGLIKLKRNIAFENLAQLINLPPDLFDDAKKVLNKLVIDLRGEINTNDKGQIIINIDKFIDELSYN